MSDIPMSDQQRLTGRLGELRGERAAVESALTKEGLVVKVDEYLRIARSHAAGSSRLALGGRATGIDLEAVLAEDLLDDDGLAGRVVKRLEAQGFGSLSDRSKASQLKKLDEKIAAATAELREARKREALERVEAEFANEAA